MSPVGSDRAGWIAMGTAVGALWIVIMAFLHVPGLRPSEDVLLCDSLGGYWSSEQAACQRSDSLLAGMAS